MQGILRTRNKKLETINNRNISKFKSLLFKIYCSRLNRGFSFVELLVVIAILGLLLSFTYASFSNFQKSTKLTNAVLQLKSDLRYVQNKALAGDKSTTKCSSAGYTLVGWYVTIDEISNSYSMNGICKNSLGTEDPETTEYKTFNLPAGIGFTDNSVNQNVRVLFQPLVAGVTIHRKVAAPPYFYNSGGVIQNQESAGVDFSVTISSNAGQYHVIIQPSGEISENKL